MHVARIVGWVLLAIAALFLLLGLTLAVLGGSVTELAGVLWSQVHAGSLNDSQAFTQRYVWPPLWDPLAISLLLMPLWLAVLIVVGVFAVPGAALTLLLRGPRAAD